MKSKSGKAWLTVYAMIGLVLAVSVGPLQTKFSLSATAACILSIGGGLIALVCNWQWNKPNFLWLATVLSGSGFSIAVILLPDLKLIIALTFIAAMLAIVSRLAIDPPKAQP